jgi:GalNAc-alpha-(1->4)-GalNAc-alpha-(1->3)-diNAcBac-PP-undecaprenol alpha-1,4-N-acetyl-D-galactosaminyltransferase
MRLLFVIHSLKMGGAERVLVNTANYFASIGYDVHIALYDAEGIFYELDERVVIYDMSLEKLSNNLLSSVKNSVWRILRLRGYIRLIKADAVISLITHVNVISIIAAKLASTPVVACEHSNYYLLKSKIFRFVRAVVYPFADVVTVLTKWDIGNYPFAKNIVVLPNPINTPIKSGVQKENLVLGVGRLVKEKGFERLIEAFLEAKEDGWRLEIVGEGVERGMLEEKIKELGGGEFVSLVGARKNVGEFYERASIFVLSSREEGFPMALCEAMSCGVASIAFDCRSGPSEIIKDGNGVLVPADDVGALKAAIADLIKNEQKRVQIAERATKINEILGVKSIAKQWEEIFKKITQRSV